MISPVPAVPGEALPSRPCPAGDREDDAHRGNGGTQTDGGTAPVGAWPHPPAREIPAVPGKFRAGPQQVPGLPAARSAGTVKQPQEFRERICVPPCRPPDSVIRQISRRDWRTPALPAGQLMTVRQPAGTRQYREGSPTRPFRYQPHRPARGLHPPARSSLHARAIPRMRVLRCEDGIGPSRRPVVTLGTQSSAAAPYSIASDGGPRCGRRSHFQDGRSEKWPTSAP